MQARLLQADRILRSALGLIAGGLFVALTVVVLLQVFSRFIISTTTWTVELATTLLVWLSLLGGALAYGERQHLGIDLLVNPMHTTPRRWLRRLGHTLVGLFALGVMIGGGTALVLDVWRSGQSVGTLPISRAWVYLPVPLSGICITLFAIIAIYIDPPPPTHGEHKLEHTVNDAPEPPLP